MEGGRTKGEDSLTVWEGLFVDAQLVPFQEFERFAHPVRRTLGADQHEEGVVELSPERGVQTVGKSEVATDTGRTRGTSGSGQLGRRARVPRECPRNPDGASDAGLRRTG